MVEMLVWYVFSALISTHQYHFLTFLVCGQVVYLSISVSFTYINSFFLL